MDDKLIFEFIGFGAGAEAGVYCRHERSVIVVVDSSSFVVLLHRK